MSKKGNFNISNIKNVQDLYKSNIFLKTALDIVNFIRLIPLFAATNNSEKLDEIKYIKVKELEFLENKWVDSFAVVLTKLKNLEKLEIDLLDNKGITSLFHFLSNRHLKKNIVQISSVNIKGDMASRIDEFIEIHDCFANSKILELNELENLCKKDFDKFVRALTRLKNLEKINFSHINPSHEIIEIDNCKVLINSLIGKNIIELNLSFIDLSSSSIEVAELLEHSSSNLQKLKLGSTCISASVLKKIAKILELNNGKLEILDLSNNYKQKFGEDMDDEENISQDKQFLESIQKIIISLKYNITLKSINLSENFLGDEEIKLLIDSMQQNKTLKELILNDRQLSDDRVLDLVANLDKFTFLKVLKIYNIYDLKLILKIQKILITTMSASLKIIFSDDDDDDLEVEGVVVINGKEISSNTLSNKLNQKLFSIMATKKIKEIPSEWLTELYIDPPKITEKDMIGEIPNHNNDEF